jgi:protein-L-isoaspartate(D-aspartate) O-methyltransferase
MSIAGSSNNVPVFAWSICVCIFTAGATHVQDAGTFAKAREQMVREDIAKGGLFDRDAVKDEAVLKAMRTVPRHEFVPAELRETAYADRPLPIGFGQTISQPYIVASMTESLNVKPGDKVLEIGTGSGYQAAVLAEIIKDVFTIEIVPQLGEAAEKRLEKLGYKNIHSKIGDGYYGWKENAPYDAIIVTAAASHIPPPLIEQLKPGGRMVIPVGSPFNVQHLSLVEKMEDGKVRQRRIMPVRFVPLTGGATEEADKETSRK